MRELSSTELEQTVGGNLSIGWMPANYSGVAISEEIVQSFMARSIRIPGFIPGPVFRPGPAVYRVPTTFLPDRESEC